MSDGLQVGSSGTKLKGHISGIPLQKILQGLLEREAFCSRLYLPFMTPSASARCWRAGGCCELFSAENSSSQGQSLDNSSLGRDDGSQGNPGEGFQQDSGLGGTFCVL